VHNTVVMTRSGGYFLSAPSATQSVKLTANLFAGTNNPGLIVDGFTASRATQADNVISQASNFSGADNIAAPNFWPNAALQSASVLQGVPDASYLFDSPTPLSMRGIVATGLRRAGALQAQP